MECWNADSKQRQNFTDVVKNLSYQLDQLPDSVMTATISN